MDDVSNDLVNFLCQTRTIPYLNNCLYNLARRNWIPSDCVYSLPSYEKNNLENVSIICQISPTNSAKCRVCGSCINKNYIRFGFPVKDNRGDYDVLTAWIHPGCSSSILQSMAEEQLNAEVFKRLKSIFLNNKDMLRWIVNISFSRNEKKDPVVNEKKKKGKKKSCDESFEDSNSMKESYNEYKEVESMERDDQLIGQKKCGTRDNLVSQGDQLISQEKCGTRDNLVSQGDQLISQEKCGTRDNLVSQGDQLISQEKSGTRDSQEKCGTRDNLVSQGDQLISQEKSGTRDSQEKCSTRDNPVSQGDQLISQEKSSTTDSQEKCGTRDNTICTGEQSFFVVDYKSTHTKFDHTQIYQSVGSNKTENFILKKAMDPIPEETIVYLNCFKKNKDLMDSLRYISKFIGSWKILRFEEQVYIARLIFEDAHDTIKENVTEMLESVVKKKITEKMNPPSELIIKLLPFQEEGLSWMYKQEKSPFRGGILADEMGMGKTIQTIALLLAAKKDQPSSIQEAQMNAEPYTDIHRILLLESTNLEFPSHASTLVVAPLAAVLQWKQEIERFTQPSSLKVLIYHGIYREALLKDINHFDVVITTYSTIENDYTKVMDTYKIVCKFCGRYFLPDKLRFHLQYFCGNFAQKTERQGKTEKKKKKAVEKAMETLNISSKEDFKNKIPSISNVYKELMLEANRDMTEASLNLAWLKARHYGSNLKTELLDSTCKESTSMGKKRKLEDTSECETLKSAKIHHGDLESDWINSNGKQWPEKLQQLVEMGFDPSVAEGTLKMTNGHLDDTINHLVNGTSLNETTVTTDDSKIVYAQLLRSKLGLSKTDIAKKKVSELQFILRQINESAFGTKTELVNRLTLLLFPDSWDKMIDQYESESIPVKDESIPVKDESIPVKDESIPVKGKSIRVKGKSIPAKDEHINTAYDVVKENTINKSLKCKSKDDVKAEKSNSLNSRHLLQSEGSKNHPSKSKSRSKQNVQSNHDILDDTKPSSDDAWTKLQQEAELIKSKRRIIKPVINNNYSLDSDILSSTQSISISSSTYSDCDISSDSYESLDLTECSLDSIEYSPPQTRKSKTPNLLKTESKNQYPSTKKHTNNLNDDDDATETVDLSLSPLHAIVWHRIILDEAHRIKGRTTATAKAIYALKVDGSRWCLTGTPLQNRVGELYSLVRFLKMDPFSYYYCQKKDCECKSLHFRFQNNKYCDLCGHPRMSHYSYFNRKIITPIKNYGYSNEGRQAINILKNDILDNILLRRTKVERAEDVKLPPLEVLIRRDELIPAERDFYESLYKQSKTQFNTYVEAGTVLHNYAHIFDILSRLRQAVDHPYLVVYGNLAPAGEYQLDKSVAEIPAPGRGNYDICWLCQDDIESHEEYVVSNCSHTFHKQCIEEYFSSAPTSETSNVLGCPKCYVPLTIDINTEPKMHNTVNISSASITDDDTLSSDFLDKNKPSKKKGILNRIKLSEFKSSTKIEALFEEIKAIQESKPDEKSIVFSQYTAMLDLIEWRLKKGNIECAKFVGSLSFVSRSNILLAFNTNVNLKVILISLKAGGEGLNLQVANNIFLMDPWWNPATEMQAIQRAHRIGQFRPVRAVRFICTNTIEEKMLQLQQKKQLVFDGIIGSNMEAMTKLTLDDLKFLFQN